MLRIKASWLSRCLVLASILFGAQARASSVLLSLNVNANVGSPENDSISYQVWAFAWDFEPAVFGKLNAFDVNLPNGAGTLEGVEKGNDDSSITRFASFADFSAIPAGIYTMTITGSLAGTKTYGVNVFPPAIPTPVSPEYIAAARAALSSAPLNSFTLNLPDSILHAQSAYITLKSDSEILYSELRDQPVGSGSVTLPLNLLKPGHTAEFLVRYSTRDIQYFPPDLVSIWYETNYYVKFVARSQPPTRLANISARGFCGTNDRVTIGGFVIGGNTLKQVLVRALGPTLISYGLGQSEVLLDPKIEVYQGSNLIATNDNWADNSNAVDITATANRIGAGQLASGDATSSASLLTLAPGAYTFVASGKLGSSGITLLEVYDADSDASGGRFVNISTRAYSTTGNGVAIGGFVISGEAPKQVLLRAVGPTLTKLGIRQADVLVDPTIELHDATHGNAILATNDNWADNANAAAITTTAARIGANAFDSADTKSSALLITLQPGVYTFIAAGKTNSSGIVLVEVYDAD